MSRDRNVLAGESQFHYGLEYRNPHPIGTEEFNAFERGYMQALKRSDRNVSSSGGAGMMPAEPVFIDTSSEEYRQQQIQQAAERYRRAKYGE